MRDAWSTAVGLLAKREYSAQELLDKLIQKGHDRQEVLLAVKKCQELDLQNDHRYAESFCRMRIRQGYGPLRIKQELQQKGVELSVITQTLDQESSNWFSYAQKVWKKKSKMMSNHQDSTTMQKKQRFLLYKGFPQALVAQVAQSDVEA